LRAKVLQVEVLSVNKRAGEVQGGLWSGRRGERERVEDGMEGRVWSGGGVLAA